MLWHIAWFEIRYWLRSWMLWIFTLVIAAMIFGAVSTDQVQVGGALSNTYRNAPFVIENYYAMVGLLTLLMATAFVNSAASRDFSHNTYQIVFTTPLRRRDFLFGRFLGATLVSVIPMLGVSVGILLAKYMPWVEPERWGRVIWGAHLKGILVFAVPNAFFMAAILFTIAVLARNEIVSFVGALLLLTGYGVSAALLSDIEREHLAALLDPFAIRTFALATKYWTVAEKNSNSLGLSGLMLWNRLLWIGVGVLFLIFAYYRFSFAERRQKVRKAKEAAEPAATSVVVLTVVLPTVAHRASSWEISSLRVRIHLAGILQRHCLYRDSAGGPAELRADHGYERAGGIRKQYAAGYLLAAGGDCGFTVLVSDRADHVLRGRFDVEGSRCSHGRDYGLASRCRSGSHTPPASPR